MTGAWLLVGAALFAADASTEGAWWVAITGPADAAAARDAGLDFGESSDGDWFLLLGSRGAVERSGLPYRPAAVYAGPGDALSPDAVAAALAALAGPAEVVELGLSGEGRPILALRIGEGSRALRVIGGLHGDETSSVRVSLAVAEALVARGAPPDTEVWVVPAANPDGLAAGTRENAAAVDLNRNFAWRWDADGRAPGDAPFSEPETRALGAMARARDFSGGLWLHSGATNIGWVWNWTVDARAPEEALLASLAEAYAGTCTAPGFWTTSGGDWYVTPGEATDWAYGQFGSHDFTLEVTAEKSPVELDYLDWHLEAVLEFLSRPPDRVAQVVDAATREPIPARIEGAGVGSAWTGPAGGHARWADDAPALRARAPGYADAPLTGQTALTREALVAELPEPRLLSRGLGARRVAFGAGTGTLTLVGPGESDVVLAADEDGGWIVDPEALAPGAWTVVTDDGVAARALFVGERDDRVAIESVALESETLNRLVVTGHGFGAGAEAWSIGGPARALHPLPRAAASTERLEFELDSDDEDLLIWSSGAWLSVLDVHGAAVFDTDAPSGHPAPELGPLGVQGACDSGSAPASGLAAGIAIALSAYRRPWRLRTSFRARFRAS